MKKLVLAAAALCAAGMSYAVTLRGGIKLVPGSGVIILVPGKIEPVVPTPVPKPAPAPLAAFGSVLSPTLDGLDPIASGVAASKYLVKSWGTGAIPPKEIGDFVGAFRFVCEPSHNAYDDPIVYPGQPGRAHLHTFFGNTAANAHSTYKSLRTTGESTCNNLLNRSAYWVPAMMNGRGKVVMPDYLGVYYKRRPASDPACKIMGKACVGLPRGLRYVFGYNMTNPAAGAPANRYWWNCDGGVSAHFENIAQAAKGCPVGARLGVVLQAPNCWNGKELDTADHRSHMAYTSYGNDGTERCPASHPYVVPTFQLAAWYTTDATLDRSGNQSASAATWHLSSDRMPGMPNAVPGTTAHADWFGAWEDSVLATWQANCVDKQLSCNSGDLGNGLQLAMLQGYKFPNKTALVDPPMK